MKKYLPLFSVILSAFMWGTTGSFMKLLENFNFNSYQIIVFRTLISGLFLILFLLIFDRQKLKVAPKDWWIFILASLVSELLFNICYKISIDETSIGMACVLMYTCPVFVTILMAIFFKDKLNVSKGISIVLAILGCVLVSGVIGNATGFSVKGILLGIASGFCYATYSLFCKIALKKYSPLTFTAYLTFLAGIFSLPLASVWELPAKLTMEWYIIPLVIAFALITNLIPYCLYSNALKTLDATKASISATLEPVVATILGVVLFDETVGWISIIGIVLVLSSSLLVNFDFSKFKKPKKAK